MGTLTGKAALPLVKGSAKLNTLQTNGIYINFQQKSAFKAISSSIYLAVRQCFTISSMANILMDLMKLWFETGFPSKTIPNIWIYLIRWIWMFGTVLQAKQVKHRIAE